MTRSEAARINGAKSHGPATPEGKARSSMNALKHGLTSDNMCICVENPAQFDEFQQRYFDQFQPQNQVELDLVKEMVSAKWRQERMWSLEAATIDFRMDCSRAKIDQAWILTPRARAAVAVNEEASDFKSFPNFARYDAMLSRMYNRALRTFRDIRANPIPPPVAEIEDQTSAEPPLQNEPKPIPINAPLRNEPSAARPNNFPITGQPHQLPASSAGRTDME
jgi:hypothetical protein